MKLTSELAASIMISTIRKALEKTLIFPPKVLIFFIVILKKNRISKMETAKADLETLILQQDLGVVLASQNGNNSQKPLEEQNLDY